MCGISPVSYVSSLTKWKQVSGCGSADQDHRGTFIKEVEGKVMNSTNECTNCVRGNAKMKILWPCAYKYVVEE